MLMCRCFYFLRAFSLLSFHWIGSTVLCAPNKVAPHNAAFDRHPTQHRHSHRHYRKHDSCNLCGSTHGSSRPRPRSGIHASTHARNHARTHACTYARTSTHHHASMSMLRSILTLSPYLVTPSLHARFRLRTMLRTFACILRAPVARWAGPMSAMPRLACSNNQFQTSQLYPPSSNLIPTHSSATTLSIRLLQTATPSLDASGSKLSGRSNNGSRSNTKKARKQQQQQAKENAIASQRARINSNSMGGSKADEKKQSTLDKLKDGWERYGTTFLVYWGALYVAPIPLLYYGITYSGLDVVEFLRPYMEDDFVSCTLLPQLCGCVGASMAVFGCTGARVRGYVGMWCVLLCWGASVIGCWCTCVWCICYATQFVPTLTQLLYAYTRPSPLFSTHTYANAKKNPQQPHAARAQCLA